MWARRVFPMTRSGARWCRLVRGRPGRSFTVLERRAREKAIVVFVDKVTKAGGPDFVPVSGADRHLRQRRHALVRAPVYVQVVFALDRIKALAETHPEWQDKQPFKAVIEGDLKAVRRAAARLARTARRQPRRDDDRGVQPDRRGLAGQGQASPVRTALYRAGLSADARTAGLPTRQWLQDVYRLGGGVEFMRPWAEQVYGIPPEQVVGSSIKLKYELRDGQPVLLRLPEIDFIDDHAGKPVGIHRFIGRRPIAAFGNSDGDYEMLRWTTAGPGPGSA